MGRSESSKGATEIERLEQMLNEGLDDIDAGGVIRQEDSRREVEALLSALEANRVVSHQR